MIFAVTSGKGGVGKSSFCVGLSHAFARMGKKTVLIDMDEGLRCLDILLNLDSRVVFDLADAVSTGEISKALYKVEGCKDLSLIPAPDKKGKITAEALGEFIAKASKQFDVIILDFPAGIDTKLYAALPPKSKFLTVAVADAVSIRDASFVARALSEIGLTSTLIINRFNFKAVRKGLYKNIDDVIDMSGLRLGGIIPESKALSRLWLTHKINKKGRTARAFARVCARLSGEKVRLPRFKKI